MFKYKTLRRSFGCKYKCETSDKGQMLWAEKLDIHSCPANNIDVIVHNFKNLVKVFLKFCFYSYFLLDLFYFMVLKLHG